MFRGIDGLPDSPHRVKGLLYLGTRTYFDARVEGGYETLLARLRPPLREFMEQPFVAGGMYEVMVVPELLDEEAAACHMPLTQYSQERTRWQAERDLGGVYRLLVRIAPPAVVVKRVVVVMGQMFNFGNTSVQRLGDRHLRVGIDGVPAALGGWLENAVGVYGQVAMERAGAGHARVRARPRSRADDSRGADPTVTLAIDIHWDDGR